MERIGNKLPHPITLFTLFAVVTIILSAVLSAFGVSATGQLVSGGELQENTVMVTMLGVGVAEQSGLIHTLLKSTVKITPKKFITPMVVFLGVMSNVANDAGYVILIPLGAMVFRAYGRYPMAGLAASTFLVTILGTWVTNHIVEPRLGEFNGTVHGEEDNSLRMISEIERKGMRNAILVAFLYAVILVFAQKYDKQAGIGTLTATRYHIA
jgi:aminobenzoyl-glutamate transport protein